MVFSYSRGSRFSRAESESTHLPLRSPSTRRTSDDDMTGEVEMAGYGPQLSRHVSGKMASEVLGYEPAVVSVDLKIYGVLVCVMLTIGRRSRAVEQAPVSPRDTIVPEESDRPSSWFFRPKVRVQQSSLRYHAVLCVTHS